MLEAEAHGISSFTELNDRFLAWMEQVCNTRVHAETGQTPIERFLSQGPPRIVESSLLREAFRWSVRRRVTRTATVSLAGNRYALDDALTLRQVELRFDPEDLSRLDVYWEGRSMGQGLPFVLGRHVHHQLPPTDGDASNLVVTPSTGVDYLGLVLAKHEAEHFGAIAFRDLAPQHRRAEQEDQVP